MFCAPEMLEPGPCAVSSRLATATCSTTGAKRSQCTRNGPMVRRGPWRTLCCQCSTNIQSATDSRLRLAASVSCKGSSRQLLLVLRVLLILLASTCTSRCNRPHPATACRLPPPPSRPECIARPRRRNTRRRQSEDEVQLEKLIVFNRHSRVKEVMSIHLF